MATIAIWLTGEDVFMYPSQLNIRLGRVRDDKIVDDALTNSFGHRMAEEVLDNDGSCVRSRPRAFQVLKASISDEIQVDWR